MVTRTSRADRNGGLRSSPVKVLVTGRGGAGSWIVRGEQLGAQIGATVRPLAETADGFDLTIVVKRTPPQVMQALQGRRWVWDIVDAYPQPESYGWERSEGGRLGAAPDPRLKPSAMISRPRACGRTAIRAFPASCSRTTTDRG